MKKQNDTKIKMDSDEDISNLEAQRIKNIKMLDSLLLEEMEDTNVDNQLKELNDFTKKNKRPPKMNVTKKDKTFKFSKKIPLTSRRSSRIAKLPVEYTINYNIEDIQNNIFRQSDETSYDNLETIKIAPLCRRRKHSLNNPAPFAAVEDVTSTYINNVAQRSYNKMWSKNGTTCHQCRQKTMDSKTYCRSGKCVGVRGQFCGPCLLNRYGEDVAVALKDPNWSCPPCRDVCNCSICRHRVGKMPTGILAPLAQAQGHKSVYDFLKTINETSEMKKKNQPQPIHLQEGRSDEEVLLGFDESGNGICEGPVCEDEQNMIAVSGNIYTYRVNLGSNVKPGTL